MLQNLINRKFNYEVVKHVLPLLIGITALLLCGESWADGFKMLDDIATKSKAVAKDKIIPLIAMCMVGVGGYGAMKGGNPAIGVGIAAFGAGLLTYVSDIL